MDKVAFYKKIVRELAAEVAQMSEAVDKPIELLRAFDDDRGQYLIYFDGWKGERRFYGCFFHIEVQTDGKIWVRHDGTELDITQLLLSKGVPKNDIVLAFQSPPARRLISIEEGYAVD